MIPPARLEFPRPSDTDGDDVSVGSPLRCRRGIAAIASWPVRSAFLGLVLVAILSSGASADQAEQPPGLPAYLWPAVPDEATDSRPGSTPEESAIAELAERLGHFTVAREGVDHNLAKC